MKLPEFIHAVVKRSRAFYRATEPGHFLISAQVPAEASDIPPLHHFDLDHQLAEWLDYRVAAARPLWRAKAGLDDDSLPSICPRFGIAEHSAWLGMDDEISCPGDPLVVWASLPLGRFNRRRACLLHGKRLDEWAYPRASLQ